MTEWGKNLKSEAVEKFKKMFKGHYYIATENEVIEEEVSKEESYFNFNSIYAVADNSNTNWEKELTEYMEAPRASADTDILLWWKNHIHLYLRLSKMARDILCLMASSVPVERLFSSASSIVSSDRCSLKYQSIRILLCIHSWMRSSLKLEISCVNL